ncbi:MAG: hypothetical protein H8K03_12745 [Nitrospira sp.]|jgi:hypothetical protein|nr:hypothetical protein [Nitrospira sp. BO4]
MTKSIAGTKNIQNDHCYRCGGLMVPEKVFEIGSFDWHCVSCGERVDPVILAHRRRDLGSGEADKLFAGKGKACLN